MQNRVILFDFDNTLANTERLRDIRESRNYDLLTDEALSKIKLYKQLPELLTLLRQQDAKIGVVTNAGTGYIKRVFEHLGLNEMFDVVVTYTDVRAEGMKPSPKGLQLAMEKLDVKPHTDILYVGDENIDIIAAYRAGVTPVMPSWASKKPISMAPAIEMSSKMLGEYFANPDEFRLFAERCAEHESANFDRKAVYFLPLDSSGNVVTVREEMASVCLGRYFSQKGAITAWIHDNHALSKAIAKKEEQNPFVIPQYWVDLLSHSVLNLSDFVFNGDSEFDIVTVIPAKPGKDPRLEKLLALIEENVKRTAQSPVFVADVFCFLEDAKSQKTLQRNERYLEANRALKLNEKRKKDIVGKRILIIDDVITTGSTLSRAQSLLAESGATTTVGLALAKTVSIMEDERPCPECGRAMRVKKNKATNERFWGCTAYKELVDPCRHTEPLMKKSCPKCNRMMKIRTNKRTGEKFWGCSGYNQDPSCSYSEHLDLSEMPN